MKRSLTVGAIFVAVVLLLLLFLPRRSNNPGEPTSESSQTTSVTNGTSPKKAATRADQTVPVGVGLNAVLTNQNDQLENGIREFNKTHNVAVAFYGLVVDQDSNALPNVGIDVEVLEQYMDASSKAKEKTTHLQISTRPDGRFEVNYPIGHSVTVERLTKMGYEPEMVQKHYGIYGAQSTTFEDPAVFRMWSTNIHEPLIAGDKSFVIVPDGRHYAIDLVKGTIAEGDVGDLTAWVKRPESARWGQRYDWACELAVPAGGLVENQGQAMFTAPEAGYANLFAYQEDAGVNGWGGLTGDRRFYVRLRNGQMYGRITINLYADYHGNQPGMIQISYAVNPSGSRLLR